MWDLHIFYLQLATNHHIFEFAAVKSNTKHQVLEEYCWAWFLWGVEFFLMPNKG